MHVMIVAGKSTSLVNFRGDLIKDMILHGHRVTAVGPELGVEERVQALGARFVQVPLKRNGMNPVQDASYTCRLMRLFRSEQPDMVLCYTIKPVIYGSIAAKIAGIKHIYSMITGLGYAFTSEKSERSHLQALVQLLYRTALVHGAKVFFQNPDDLQQFVQTNLVGANAAVLINGSGVNLDWYEPQPLPPEPVFLMICRILRDKGVHEYLSAARLVKREHPEARFLLVGPFDSNPTALKQTDLQPFIDEGVIEYCGRTTDVRPYLRDCRAYVLPSYREGTPRTVLEAMSTGRPIITTDAPGCRETVINGKNGFLVPVRDSRALADKMTWILNHPEETELMAAASLALVREKYDVRKVNETILQTMGLSAPHACRTAR